MRKFKGLKFGKGKRDMRKIGAAIVAAMMVVALVIGLIPNETAEVLAADKVSDYGTETKYTESLGDNASTEYSGRIWTDKSVYSESVTFDLYTPEGEATQRTATVSKDADSDFLVAFSALGTTQAVSGQTQAPVDVVFVIDTSGSMQDDMSNTDTTDRIVNAVTALNDSIEKVMKMNPYTRVGVVAFSDTAQTILPLGRYEKGTRSYQTGGTFWNPGQTVTVTNYFSLQSNSLYAHVLPEGSTEQTTRNRNVTGGTNIQMGLYTGLNMLAQADTTVQIESTEVTRVPSLILLSDGAPTYSSSSSNWWAPTNNNNDGPGGSPYAGNGMKALMTGAYMKEIVNDNYGIDATIYTIGMGISGLSNYESYYGYRYYTGEQDLAYMTLDPANYWTEDNDMANAIEAAWNTYTAGRSATITVDDGDNYTFEHPTGTGIIDIGDLDDNDSSINPVRDFVDDYYDADSAGEVTDVFDEIVSNIAISAPQVPTEVKNPDAIDADGYITYTDPLGKYMEVKDVKAISYAGTVYTKDNSTKTVKTISGTETTYEFAAEVQSAIYGDQNMKNILITVTEDGEGMETITIKIPASVIPVRLNTVLLNADGTVKSHTNNGAYPVRVFYTVGLKDGLIENGVVKIGDDGVSAEYIEANSNEDGTVNFYSNLYTGENEVIVLDDGKEIHKTVGNATVEFEPSHTNTFYYIEKDMPIYKDAAGTVQVTAGEGIKEDGNYYYKNTYYHGTSIETEIALRTGAQLLKTDIIEIDGYLYRAKGSPRLNRILIFEGEKIDNNTKTAEDFYAPTFEYASGSTDPYDGKFVVYLGNNGVISVAASGRLEISKDVNVPEGLTPTTTEFEFRVNLDGANNLAGEYAYSVVNANDQVLRGGTITDGGTLKLADGETAVIRNLPLDVAYEVIEVGANSLGFTTQSSGTTGTIQAGTPAKAAFVNTYAVDTVKVGASDGFQVSKTLKGRHWNGDAFTFLLESVDAATPMPSGSTNGVKEITIREDAGEDYKVNEAITETFGEIVYNEPGTYVYTIAEKMPASSAEYLPGISYSGAIYRIEVEVVDNGTGQLVATTTMIRTNGQNGTLDNTTLAEGSEVAAFENEYSADNTAWTPVGTKHYEDLSGNNPMMARMFQFRIQPIGANAATAPMPKNGTVGTGADRYYDANNIATEIAYPQIVFEHDMASTAGTTYQYKLSEVDAGKPGITYDSTTYTVTVVAKLDSTTAAVQLNVSYAKDNASGSYSRAEFSNKYEPTPVKADIVGSKTLTGIAPAYAADFQVKIEGADTASKEVLATSGLDTTVTISDSVINTANTFNIVDDLEFTKPGTYTFNVTEVNAGQTIKGITYDSHTEVVTVVVEDKDSDSDGYKDGVLTVESITYSNGTVDNAAFANTYASTFVGNPISLEGTKKLTGRDIAAGEFFFVVEPKGNAPMGRASIATAGTDGTIQLLKDVTFIAAGTYEYWFYEYIPSSASNNILNGVTYDTTVYKYVVEVEDNRDGTFGVKSTSLYKASGTRDENGYAVVANNAWGAALTGANEAVVFENVYNTESAIRTVPTLQKILAGYRADSLKANEFQFAMSVSAVTLDGTAIPKTGESLVDYITLNNRVEDSANGILGKVSNAADGSINFGDLSFHKTGIYTLTFEEVIPADNDKVAGVTYSEETLEAVFKVVDNGLGQLEAELLNLHGSYSFINEYKSEGELQLTIEKILAGREWKDTDKFQAEVVILDPETQAAVDAGEVVFPSDADGIQKVTLTKDKKSATSPEITIYKPGTYKFVVREVAGSIPGISYDASRYEIVVTATDNSNGKITVTTNITDNKVTFTNVYDTDSTVLSGHDNLWVKKEFIGRDGDKWLDTDVFTFTLAPGNTATEKAVGDKDVELASTTLEVTNTNKAHAHFGAITFHKAGTYTFTVTEEASNLNYIVNDSDNVRTIIVNVKDDSAGNLVATLSADSDSLEFKNKYIAKEVELEGATNLKVEKILTGRDWFDSDEFEFTLIAYDDITAEAVNPTGGEEATIILPANAAGITISKADLSGGVYTKAFGDIIFKKAGTYKFQIKETKGNIDNLTYDSHSSVITVVVTDDNAGQLVATPSYSGKMIFENIYTPDPVTATLTGTKVLNGRTLKAGEFRFHIEAASNSEENTPLPATRTVANDENGIVTFATMTYTEAGTYRYTISEIKGHLAGVTYDEEKVEATVEVTYDSAIGILKPVVTYKKGTSGTEFKFVNTYSTEPVGVTDISALKTVSTDPGIVYQLKGDDFRFEIEPAASNPENDPVPRGFAGNDTHGIVTLFKNVVYTEAGTYVYTVHEVDGVRPGILYDDSVFTITVVVTDDESVAELSAEVSIQKTKDGATTEVENIEFDNGYSATSTTAVIHGHKTLKSEHKALEAGEFSFELRAVGQNAANTPMPADAVDGVATAVNAETGLFQFGVITYTAEGTYKYQVREVIPTGAVDNGNGTWTLNGKIYDATVREVTVTVANDTTEGALKKSSVVGIVDGNGDPMVTFENGYVPNAITLEGNTALQGKKTLSGRDMNAGEFEFEIAAITTNAPMPANTTATNVGDGAESTFVFDAITFRKAGEYLYNITETATGKGGVTYDGASFVAKVTVTDDGYDGQLDAAVTYYKNDAEAALEFNNSYKADSVGLILGMLKRLNGRDLNEGEFTFEIKAMGDAPMPTSVVNGVAIATNAEDGKVVFDEITYDKVGTYEYEISEVKGSVPGVTYDESVHKITVTVTDNLEGKLEAKAEGIDNLVFTNVYKAASTTAQIGATKKLTGRDMKAGEFKFVLEDKDGNKVYATNAADGSILFEDITYEAAGTYVYKLYEEKGKADYVKYDDKVYTVVVVVEDDLKGKLHVTSEFDAEHFVFNNTYEKPAVVETGDTMAALPMMLMFVLSAGYVLVAFVKARKR